jgi:hypothetical protein
VVGKQGAIHVFDLHVPNDGEDSSETMVKHPDLTFKGHSGNEFSYFSVLSDRDHWCLFLHVDSVPCVAFHPYRPILLSASGSRHFDDVDDQVDSDWSTDSDEPESTHEVTTPKRRGLRLRTVDSSIKTWNFDDAGNV